MVVLHDGDAAVVSRCLEGNIVELSKANSHLSIQVPLGDVTLLPAMSETGKQIYNKNILDAVESASSTEIKIAAERFAIISQYLAREVNLPDAVKRLGVSKARFYQLVKMFDADVGMASFIRVQRGAKLGERRLESHLEELIAQAIKKKRPGKRLTYNVAFEEVRAACAAAKLPFPSKSSVTSRIKSLANKEAHRLMFGAEAAEQKFGAKPGSHKTTRALEIVQMDHTVVDIILCDSETRKPIGRPWLTVLIDVHTRVLLGYYLGFHAPSLLTVATAICHAAFPKDKQMVKHGLDPKWYPCYGIPEILHMDNAKEFRSAQLERACSLYGIQTKFRPYGKKHYGGVVERYIGTMMTSKVHFLPGTTRSNVLQRKGYDSEANSALSFKEFSSWFAGEVATYHATYHQGIQMSPRAAWDKAFKGTDGEYLYPPLLHDPFRFRLDFLPETRRSIRPIGIEFNGMRYWSPDLAPFIGEKNVVVKYDPMSLSKIWIKLDRQYVEASFSDITQEDMTLEDSRLLRKQAKALNVQDLSLIAGLQARDSAIVENGVRESKKRKKSLAAKKEYSDYMRDMSGGVRPLERSPVTVSPSKSVNYLIKPPSLPSEDSDYE